MLCGVKERLDSLDEINITKAPSSEVRAAQSLSMVGETVMGHFALRIRYL